MDIRFYVSRFLRQIHWFALVVILFAAAGLVAARVMPTVYVASALMVVESEQIPDALARSTVQTQAGEQLQIIEQRILARDKLLEVANRLKVYDVIRPGGEKPMTAGEIVQDMRERVAIDLQLDRGGNSEQASLVRVSFDAPTGQLAAAVTNELVTLILEEDVAMRTVVARQTLEFFQQEAERLAQALAERSAAILAFKEKNLSALPDSLDFRREELTRVETRIAELEREEAALNEQIDRIARLRGGAATSSTGDAEGGAATAQVTTRDIRREDLAAQLDALGTERARLESRRVELTTSIAQTPGNAVQLEALERDYENVRSQYDLAVTNRAKAETGETIEALSKGQRITVIEQAVAPDEPQRPNRPKIMAAGLGAGVIAGLGLVAVLEFLRGAIRRPADLTAALGITPFATLPYVRTRAEQRRNRVIALLFVLGLLALAVGGLWYVHEAVMPLDLVLDRLRERIPPWLSM